METTTFESGSDVENVQPPKAKRFKRDKEKTIDTPQYICESYYKTGNIEITSGLSLANFEPRYCLVDRKKNFIQLQGDTLKVFLDEIFKKMTAVDSKRNRTVQLLKNVRIRKSDRKGLKRIVIEDDYMKQKLYLNIDDVARLAMLKNLIISDMENLELNRYSIKAFYAYFLRANYCQITNEEFSLPQNETGINYKQLVLQFEAYLRQQFADDLRDRRFVIQAKDIIAELLTHRTSNEIDSHSDE